MNMVLTQGLIIGTLPSGLCQMNGQGPHPLTVLLLDSNQLSGSVDLTFCVNLVHVDLGVSK